MKLKFVGKTACLFLNLWIYKLRTMQYGQGKGKPFPLRLLKIIYSKHKKTFTQKVKVFRFQLILELINYSFK